MPADDISTLQQMLERAAAWTPSKGITYVGTTGVRARVSYAELLASARSVAAWLAGEGVAAGQPVVLALSANETFVRAFWGCLFAGAVPVPLAAPRGGSGSGPMHERLANVVDVLGRPYVLGSLPAVLPDGDARTARVAAQPSDIALIQFSSGSTGAPKGVVLTHANVLANLAAIRAGIAVTPDDVGVSWMPLHHDLGLIGLLLGSISVPNDLVLIDTEAFVRRPLLWLDALESHRGTITASPSFGLSLVLSRLDDDRPRNLASVRVILNGGEPISVGAMERFAARLAPSGLRPAAMFPVYGLAEATLAVTFPVLGDPPVVMACDRQSLRAGEHVREAAPGSADGMRVTSVGRPVQGCDVRIVNDDDRALEDGAIGHIQVRGPSVAAGYYADAVATAAAWTGEWLRTGDLGFVREEELFVTGRAKDVLFVHGRNLFAHDIEHALAEVVSDGVRVAVCGWRGPEDQADRLLLFVGTRGAATSSRTFRSIGSRVEEIFGLRPHAMIPMPAAQFPRTTSGKIQRHRLRERYERGDFDEAISRLVREIEESAPLDRTAPRTDAERLIHGIWARELGLRPDEIGVHASFEHLGGTSLTALLVVQAIEDACGVHIESEAVQRLSSVAALAAFVESQRGQRLPGQRRHIYRG